jgi:hypothetical protein
LGGLGIFSCSNRTDILFSASDELHSIELYENDTSFSLMYSGFNTVEGKYQLKEDTILLTYFEGKFEGSDPNEVLTRKILINTNQKKVKSLDNSKQFCGFIGLDKRNNLK